MMVPEEGGADEDEGGDDEDIGPDNASDDSADEFVVADDVIPGSDRRRRRRRPGKSTLPDPDSGSDSPLSALSEEEGALKAPKQRRKPGRADPSLEARQVAPLKLTREQKDWIARMWETMFEGSPLERGQRLMGREQVKRWAGVMGEMWSDDEVRGCEAKEARWVERSSLCLYQLTEMIELFSTQPGKRGLSYDDFSTLLIRGGLV